MPPSQLEDPREQQNTDTSFLGNTSQSEQAEYNQYFKTVEPVSSTYESFSEIPSHPTGSPLGLTLLTGYFWLTLIGSIILTGYVLMLVTGDNSADNAGAGWILILSVPGIFFGAVGLLVIYITKWLMRRAAERMARIEAAEGKVLWDSDTQTQSAKAAKRYAICFFVFSIMLVLLWALGLTG